MTVRELPRPTLRQQLGYMRRLAKEPQPVLDEMRQRHGPVLGFGFGPVRGAVIGDPDTLDEMFSTSTDSFRWGHKFNVLGFVVGDGSMIVSDGDDHKRRRSSVQAAFSRRRLNTWMPMIVERTDLEVDRLIETPSPRPVDLYPVGHRIVFSVVVRAFFGERLASRVDELAELFERAQAYLESPGLRQLPHPFPFTARARVRADRAALDALLDEEIAHQRRHPASDPFDVLAALVADGDLDDAEIRDQVVTMIGAGYHTTAASLAWMLWRAALTPGIWAELGAEADDVFGAGPEPDVDDTTLARLELSDRVMRETLRLHPAGVFTPREAAADVTVGGVRVPKGTLILWSPYLAGRDEAAWPDPLTFDPDRFIDLDSKRRTLADATWVPFGRGPRNCIGFALAQMELTLILARLAQRLDVEPTSATMPGPTGMVVNRPDGGVPLRLSARASSPIG